MYSNGYTNGSYRTDPLEETEPDEDTIGGSRQRRAGGYGGFYRENIPSPADPDTPLPETSLRRQATGDSNGGFGLSASGRRDTYENDSSRSRERVVHGQNNPSPLGSGPGGKQIEGQLLLGTKLPAKSNDLRHLLVLRLSAVLLRAPPPQDLVAD